MVVNGMFFMAVTLVRVRKKLRKTQEVLDMGLAFYLVILLKQFNSFATLNSFMSCIAVVVKFSNGLSRGAQPSVSVGCKSDVWKASILTHKDIQHLFLLSAAVLLEIFVTQKSSLVHILKIVCQVVSFVFNVMSVVLNS